jgi:hypothetical protein
VVENEKTSVWNAVLASYGLQLAGEVETRQVADALLVIVPVVRREARA